MCDAKPLCHLNGQLTANRVCHDGMQEQGKEGCLPCQDPQVPCSGRMDPHHSDQCTPCWILWRVLLWIWYLLLVGSALAERAAIPGIAL